MTNKKGGRRRGVWDREGEGGGVAVLPAPVQGGGALLNESHAPSPLLFHLHWNYFHLDHSHTTTTATTTPDTPTSESSRTGFLSIGCLLCLAHTIWNPRRQEEVPEIRSREVPVRARILSFIQYFQSPKVKVEYEHFGSDVCEHKKHIHLAK